MFNILRVEYVWRKRHYRWHFMMNAGGFESVANLLGHIESKVQHLCFTHIQDTTLAPNQYPARTVTKL